MLREVSAVVVRPRGQEGRRRRTSSPCPGAAAESGAEGRGGCGPESPVRPPGRSSRAPGCRAIPSPPAAERFPHEPAERRQVAVAQARLVAGTISPLSIVKCSSRVKSAAALTSVAALSKPRPAPAREVRGSSSLARWASILPSLARLGLQSFPRLRVRLHCGDDLPQSCGGGVICYAAARSDRRGRSAAPEFGHAAARPDARLYAPAPRRSSRPPRRWSRWRTCSPPGIGNARSKRTGQ